MSDIEKNIIELENFINDLSKTQLKYPLDKESQDVAQQDTLLLTGFLIPTTLGNFDFGLRVSINDKRYKIPVTEIFTS